MTRLLKLTLTIGLVVGLVRMDGLTSAQEVKQDDGIPAVVDRVSQTVVRITVSVRPGTTWDEPARDLFDLLERMFGSSIRGGREVLFGSGVVVKPDGLVLTTSVLFPEGKDKIEVATADGRTLVGKLVAIDRKGGVALVKVDTGTKPLKPARLGTSKGLKPGRFVVALGNPFGVVRDNQCSGNLGVISAMRPLEERKYSGWGDVLHTDAGVNPGNFGGPLIDVEGKVVGVIAPLVRSPRTFTKVGVAIQIDRISKWMSKVKMDLKESPNVSKESASGNLAAVEEVVQDISSRIEKAVVGLEPLGRVEGVSPFLGSRPLGPFTGLLIDAEGWIVTSALSVRTGIDRVRIHLFDGTTRTGRIRGADKRLDIYLIQIETIGNERFAFAEVAEANIRVGQIAVAVGATFRGSTGPSINVGIISAKGRHGGRTLQTDAAVHPGNVGGPLLDLQGRVLGILIPTRGTSWNSGVGFAAYGSLVKRSLPAMKKGLVVLPAFLGVRLADPKSRGAGARVVEVVRESAAQKGGIKTGDLIQVLGGQSVRNAGDISRILGSRAAGDRVEVEIERDGARKRLSVRLGRLSD